LERRASSDCAVAGQAGDPGAWWREDRGQGLVEYALILMFVGLVLAGALLTFGVSVGNLIQPIIGAL
jgi:Flp pilus assembly pilin Flp